MTITNIRGNNSYSSMQQKQQKRLIKFSLILESDRPINLIEDWIKTQLNVLESNDILENYVLTRRQIQK